MNPALIESLQAVARAAEAAGHGKKSAVYQQAANEMGMSLATLHKKLSEVAMKKQRKKRADSGEINLTLDDARMISAYLSESSRNNGKRLASIKTAIEVLRANGEITATRLDENTGELVPLSESAIARGLRHYGLHLDQQSRPTPKISLASLHPNHVWQIDPSLCVLYYLRNAKGLQVMNEKEFYKNKPANIAKIENERIWRYVITDHTSGWIFVYYVLGAESGKNLVEAFIAATQKRHAQDPVHGIPKMVMVDPGSANTGAVFNNLCRALGVHVQVNEPGQPWAKGQVEKANDIVECEFEHCMKFLAKPPTTLEEINDLAWRWMRNFNATKIHTRTGQPRYAVWMKITAEQLVFAPPEQVMRELAISHPVSRKVSPQLEIQFEGRTYSVKEIPHAAVGEKLFVTRNPWRADGSSAQVIYTNEEGRTVIQVVEAIKVNDFGFDISAPVIGEEYKSHGDSYIDTERKRVERLVMDAPTDEESKKNRKAKKVPFGGRINPMKPIDDTPLVDYLSKRGTASEVVAPMVEDVRMTHVAAAKKLAARLGNAWNGSEHFPWIKQAYPNGILEAELSDIAHQLQQVNQPALRLIK